MTAPNTPSLAGLAAALAKVQAELPKLERDRTVEVEKKAGGTYSYSYVTLANLSDAILPLLAKHGLSFATMPGTGSDGKMCLRYHLLHESGESLTGEFPISGEGGIQMIGGRITYARRYCLAALVGVAADEDDESRLSEDGRPATAQRAAARPRQQRQSEPAEGGQTAQRAARPAAASRAAQPPLPGEQSDQQSARFAAGAINDAQQRKLHACLREAGIGSRDEGLAYISDVLDKTVSSTKELSRQDAARVIDRLERFIAQQEPPVDGGEGR
ncbi:ERF family protein [Micromonospora sp. C41]|uniref:ERF family protein n=1 Tax=Micromonospora sp. C41 TaxID=2824878 RepID=UPI001B35B403|nr:ERF family protein [Micromonospora sp. C41]MBQ1061311.1 ERF family protein [Micromonospora sp. C41]